MTSAPISARIIVQNGPGQIEHLKPSERANVIDRYSHPSALSLLDFFDPQPTGRLGGRFAGAFSYS